MARLPIPILTVVIGEGGSGGALALGVGNRVQMLENAIYSVISPESCAAIIWRDSSNAEKAAEALKLTAPDLVRLKLVDDVIPEPPGGAHEDLDAAAKLLADSVAAALADLATMDGPQLLNQRYEKFRRMGNYFTE